MTAQTLTLADFLLARIAEDEAAALNSKADAASGNTLGVPPSWMIGVAARVLAECEAKRRIVELMSDEVEYVVYSDDVLRALAQPYADHPDFREEWRA